MTIEYLSLYSENLDRLFFGLKNKHLNFLVPVHSVLTGASHLASLMRIPNGYDLYHVTDATLGLISRLRGPSIVTVHDLAPFLRMRDSHYSLTDAFMRTSMKNILHSEAVICDSRYVAEQIRRVFHLPNFAPHVVPLGVNHELFRPRRKDLVRDRLGLPPNKKIILNVGSEEPRKNVHTLVKAFRKLLLEGFDAILVRVGSQESSEVRQLLCRAPLKENVFYLRVSREELAQLYSSADLSVFPSFYEGFGLPILEAMASGCPVIASEAASVPEVLGEAGILLDPLDWEGFAKCMTDVLESRHRANELSELGLKRSVQFSWNRTAKETWRVMETVLDKLTN